MNGNSKEWEVSLCKHKKKLMIRFKTIVSQQDQKITEGKMKLQKNSMLWKK